MFFKQWQDHEHYCVWIFWSLPFTYEERSRRLSGVRPVLPQQENVRTIKIYVFFQVDIFDVYATASPS